MQRFFLAVGLIAALPLTAAAQRPDDARFHVGATIGTTEYDLSGVGTATVYGGRAGVWLNRIVGVEAQLGRAALDETAGDAVLYFPEAQLQLRWPINRFAPYLGAGAGVIVADSRDPQVATDSDVAFSTAGGVTADLTRGMLVLAEARVRGIGTRFTGSTGDLSIGLGYRF